MPTDEIYAKGQEWRSRIRALSEAVWEGRAKEQVVKDWLNGFVGEVCDAEIERYYALYLLHQFIYFGQAEIDALLYSMFRSHILYPQVQQCLGQNPSLDDDEIKHALEEAVAKMRIIPVGDVSESAAMLSYRLRQIAGLPPEAIRTMGEVLDQLHTDKSSITHVVLTDDFLGTGDQLCEKHNDQVQQLASLGVRVDYVALVGMQRGLDKVRSGRLFDNVNAVVILDHSYSLSCSPCIHMNELDDDCPPLSSAECLRVIRHYGDHLFRGHPMGYKNCGVMVGFNHNTPDNSVPIFWVRSKPHHWTPIFERHSKVGGFYA